MKKKPVRKSKQEVLIESLIEEVKGLRKAVEAFKPQTVLVPYSPTPIPSSPWNPQPPNYWDAPQPPTHWPTITCGGTRFGDTAVTYADKSNAFK